MCLKKAFSKSFGVASISGPEGGPPELLIKISRTTYRIIVMILKKVLLWLKKGNYKNYHILEYRIRQDFSQLEIC